MDDNSVYSAVTPLLRLCNAPLAKEEYFIKKGGCIDTKCDWFIKAQKPFQYNGIPCRGAGLVINYSERNVLSFFSYGPPAAPASVPETEVAADVALTSARAYVAALAKLPKFASMGITVLPESIQRVIAYTPNDLSEFLSTGERKHLDRYDQCKLLYCWEVRILVETGQGKSRGYNIWIDIESGKVIGGM